MNTSDNHREVDFAAIESSNDTTIQTMPSIEVPTQQQSIKYMFLLSLQWSEIDNKNNESFSKMVYDIWKWKDMVLGDGRDYFLPKSNTLRALQKYIIQQTNIEIPKSNVGQNTVAYSLSECVILSNCARFEVMIVVDTVNVIDDDNLEEMRHQFRQQLQDRVVSDLSLLLYAQVQSYNQNNRNSNNIFASTTSFMDRPDVIDMNAMVTLHRNDPNVITNGYNSSRDVTRQIQEMHKYWNVLSNVTDIISHLCDITVGIASRPRRPDRMVPFRPFSSRDAHILLQFKRTTDIATTTKSSKATSSTNSNSKKHSNRILLLLQYAIRAGKAARNPQRVPILNTLRQQYGETGNSNKYDIIPPQSVMDQVLQSVHEIVIQPTVQECVQHFDTMIESSTTKQRIQSLRYRALDMATTNEERQYILTQLHLPTMYLRHEPTRQSQIEDDANRIDVNTLPEMVVAWNETMFLEELSFNLTATRRQKQVDVAGITM